MIQRPPSPEEAPASPGADEDQDPDGWRQEGKDLLRGVAAGSLVGMPLLFTMEMWWHGMRISPRHQLVFLGVMLLSNAVASYFAGFRKEHGVAEAASESVSAVALGLVMSLVILVLIREVTFAMAAGEILGKVLVEAGPVSLGVTFANIHVRNKSRTGDDEDEEDDALPISNENITATSNS